MPTWAKGTFKKWSPSSGQPGQPGEPSDQPGEAKPSDKPGEGAPSDQKVDDVHKDIEKKLSGRNEIGSDEEAKEKEEQKEKAKPRKSPGKGGAPGTDSLTDLESRKAEIDKIVPKMNWRSMIKMMVSSSIESIDTSYVKPSRRGLTGISVAAQTGAGALKPGEKIDEQKHNRVALVFDTSGSMWGTIPVVLAEVKTLLKQLGKSNYPITVVFFAGSADWYQVNLGDKSYHKINSVAEVGKTLSKKDASPDYERLLTSAGSGGTNLSSSLVNGLDTLANMKYNVMIFSDSDLLYGENFKNLSYLWSKHRNSVFMIWDSLEVWRESCKQLGQIPKTFTYLPT